jgi:uncharacterized protein
LFLCLEFHLKKLMKKIFLIVFTLACCNFIFAQNLLPRPSPPRLVNDNAHVLSAADAQQLEQKLDALNDSTSNQIAIVTIPTLNDYPIEDYATKLFRAWGIGNKKTNNGVLILVATDDHQVRIEVGYGLEGAIPDITAGDIIETDLKPNFKSGDYYKGLDAAVNSLSQAAVGEYKIRRPQNGTDDDDSGSPIGFIVIIIIVIIVIIIRSGRGGGGMMSRSGSGWLLWPLLFNSLSGGGRSGGFGGGGGFSGGGFGGFGGGSSGGGGASGSW